MPPNKRRYVIYAPDYDEDIGGSIVLHRLCDLLNKNNIESCLYRIRPQLDKRKSFCHIRQFIKNILFYLRRKKCKTCESFDTPLCDDIDINNDIIVYPETVIGNPLSAKHVVRWLLNKPGYFYGEFTFSKNDMFFYYQKAFLNNENIENIGGELKIVHFNKAYINHNDNQERKGVCYILRKGKDRKMVHDLNNSVLVDGLTHEQIAEVFNTSKVCISYDMYTLYSRYAAVCGCLSVVIPEDGVDKYQWRPEEELRWGIAYGFDDVESAKKTREKVLPSLIRNEEVTNKLSIDNFIIKCEEFFN